jgi:hypothetical protein
MSIAEPILAEQARRPRLHEVPGHTTVEISQAELIGRIRRMRYEAHQAGRRSPGRACPGHNDRRICLPRP